MGTNLKEVAQEVQGLVVEWRRFLHKNAWGSWKEDWTIDQFLLPTIRKLITDQGYKTGLIFQIQTGKGGIWVDVTVDSSDSRRYLFRADIDALNNVTEDTGVDYASTNPGMFHGCGHDAHTAMLLAAFSLITRGMVRPNKNLRIVFQRCEEDYTNKEHGGSGGYVMVTKDGVCDGITAAFALHVWSQKPSGEFWTRPNVFTVNSDRAELVVKTKGGHAGMPEKSENPIGFLVDLLPIIRDFPQRLVGYADGPAIIAHTGIHAGGDISTANTVPIEARAFWSIRTGTPQARSAIRTAFEQLIATHLTAQGVGSDLDYTVGHPSVINNPELVEKTAALLGPDVHANHPIIQGGEDMGHVAQQVPTAYWLLGTGGIEGVTDFMHHKPQFNVDESVLWKGVWFWLQLATNEL